MDLYFGDPRSVESAVGLSIKSVLNEDSKDLFEIYLKTNGLLRQPSTLILDFSWTEIDEAGVSKILDLSDCYPRCKLILINVNRDAKELFSKSKIVEVSYREEVA